MRMMLRFEIDTETGNQLVRSGQMEKTMQAVFEELNPETAYFTPQGGKRGGFFIFDLADMVDGPRLLEPLFETLHAKVEMVPVMTADELRTGLSRIGAR